jgi:hypothetical protein
MDYDLNKINRNQGQINFLLVEVDQRVIWTLKEILKVLETVTALPPIAPHLKNIDITGLKKALEDAGEVSKRVASITPPGCVEPPPPPLPPPPGGDPDGTLYQG